ncbi:hypothetical protein PRZ48_011776 [Zasmidium cellare]|uniref:BTB domain-containing protein n=1 Tax=Zasmidium cellare TaxID=395010 RepID=A0ABR0E7B5_ZASCE|nr:hypothetical protein PRZ48_011776 [Zasmidium cellare]
MANQRPPANPSPQGGFGPGGGFRPGPMPPALAGQQKSGGFGNSKAINSPGQPNRPKQEQASSPPPNVSKSLVERVQKSFDSGKYSDLTVICGNRRWKVHKFQLCQGSEVFETMLQGHFKEASQNEISLPGDDAGAVNHILRYMYHLQYRPAPAESNRLVLHMRVAKAADKYKMLELCNTAKTSFRIDIVNNVHLQTFADAVTEAYGDDGYDFFRAALVRSTVTHLDAMRSEPAKYNFLWDVIDSVGQYSSDILRTPPPAPATTFQDILDTAAANRASGNYTPKFDFSQRTPNGNRS